jgi:hypothetical protein
MKHPRTLVFALLALGVAMTSLPGRAAAITVAGDAVADNTLIIFTAATENPGMVVNATGNWKCFSATPLVVNFSTADRYLYIATYSDHGVGQGLLHDLSVDGNPVYSGSSFWTVAPGDTVPGNCAGGTPAEVAAIGASLNARIPTMAFVPTSDGCFNTIAGCYAIWGNFAAINSGSRWTWFNSGAQVSPDAPFKPGFNHRELLVFRLDMFAFLATPVTPASWGAIKSTYR